MAQCHGEPLSPYPVSDPTANYVCSQVSSAWNWNEGVLRSLLNFEVRPLALSFDWPSLKANTGSDRKIERLLLNFTIELLRIPILQVINTTRLYLFVCQSLSKVKPSSRAALWNDRFRYIRHDGCIDEEQNKLISALRCTTFNSQSSWTLARCGPVCPMHVTFAGKSPIRKANSGSECSFTEGGKVNSWLITETGANCHIQLVSSPLWVFKIFWWYILCLTE